jgi:hypothetical protein
MHHNINLISQWVRQIVIYLQELSGYIIHHKSHSPCIGLLVNYWNWSDQPCTYVIRDKLSSPCMYTWWLTNSKDQLFEQLFVRIECWKFYSTGWLGSTNIQKFLKFGLGVPSDYLSLGCREHLKIKTRRENKHWTDRVDSQLRRVVLIFSEKLNVK